MIIEYKNSRYHYNDYYLPENFKVETLKEEDFMIEGLRHISINNLFMFREVLGLTPYKNRLEDLGYFQTKQCPARSWLQSSRVFFGYKKRDFLFVDKSGSFSKQFPENFLKFPISSKRKWD